MRVFAVHDNEYGTMYVVAESFEAALERWRRWLFDDSIPRDPRGIEEVADADSTLIGSVGGKED